MTENPLAYYYSSHSNSSCFSSSVVTEGSAVAMAAWSLVCIPLFLLCYCQLNEALGQPSVVTCTVHSCLAERLDNGDPAGNCNTSAIDERCYSGKQVLRQDCLLNNNRKFNVLFS